MNPTERDAGYLWDILDAARTVQGFVRDTSLEDYRKDRKLQLAVERAIEIIGEAAGRVSEEFQEAHPEIPWRPIVAQRHVLAHGYAEIEQDRIWRVATADVADLVALLEPLVPPAPSEGESP